MDYHITHWTYADGTRIYRVRLSTGAYASEPLATEREFPTRAAAERWIAEREDFDADADYEPDFCAMFESGGQS